MTPKPNPHVLKINRAPQGMEGRNANICLDRNERYTPFDESIFNRMVSRLTPHDFCSYPDTSPLLHALAKTNKIDRDCIYLTNGSDSALRLLFQAYAQKDRELVCRNPTYAMTSIYGEIANAKVRSIEYDENRKVSLATLLEALENDPTMMVLANPDQPTGATIEEDDLLALCKATNEKGVLLVIDEAYYPFHPLSAANYIHQFDNLAVTRTFSKWGGLAGLRLGYLLSNPQIINTVQKVRGSHEVNSVAAKMAQYILEHPEVTDEYVSTIEASRAKLREFAQSRNLGFPSCPANFQLVEFESQDQAIAAANALEEENILVRSGFKETSVAKCIRITLDTEDIIGKLIDILVRFLTKHQPMH